MKYSYALRIEYISRIATNELSSLMMDQARISTRQRFGMWKLDVSSHYSCINFRRKTDRDDFLEVFETENEEFLTRHGLVLVSANTSPSPNKCAASSLMPVSVRPKR